MLKSPLFLVALLVGVALRIHHCTDNKENKVSLDILQQTTPKQQHEVFTPVNAIGIKSGKTNHNSSTLSHSVMCPEGFLYKYTQQTDICYTILPPKPFPPKCPFPAFLALTQYDEIYNEYKHKKLWLMIKRNTTQGFAPFEWIINSNVYGLPIYHYTGRYHDITEKECMIIHNSDFIPVSCNDNYQALCIYPFNYKFINNYCQKHYANSNGYVECIADSLNIENHKCYCERFHTSEQQIKPPGTRHLLCDTFAEPLMPFQSDLLLHQFPALHDACWIGLYQDANGVTWWNRSKEKVNYDYWSTSVDYSQPFGAMKFIDDAGWILTEDDGTIQCGICQIENNYNKTVSIKLRYIASTDSIELRINNPLEISDYFGKEHSLFCFVGPTTHTFKEKIYAVFEEIETYNQRDDKVWIGYIRKRFNYPVYFWCEAFQHPNLTLVYSNKILVHKSLGGHEYAFRIQAYENKDPYLNGSHLKVCSYINERLGYENEFRLMNVLSYDPEKLQMEMLFHLTTIANEDEQVEYHKIESLLHEMVAEDTYVLGLISFGRSDVCLPTSTGVLKWPKTSIGAVTLPTEICLQENGQPVVRKCLGDFLSGGFWSNVSGSCSLNIAVSDTTVALKNLLAKENTTADELSENLSRITEDSQHVTAVEIYLIAQVLARLETYQEVNISDVVTSISNVMNFDIRELRNSQKILNCTDKILCSLNNILVKTKIDENKTYHYIPSPKVLVQISDVETTNITGFVIKSGPQNNFTLIPIYNNVTINKLLEEDIELAAFLPNNLLNEIKLCMPTIPIKLVMVLFHNDVLFNESVNKTRQPNSRIVDILIPNFDCTLSTPIPIIFNPIHNVNFEEKCAHWKYGLDDQHENNIKGRWSEDSIPKQKNTNSSYVICSFSHITHFALLMMGSFTKNIPDNHVLVLDIITIIGTVLSLTSIVAMFIFAAYFKNWRRLSSNKILLNFSIAIAMQLILLHLSKGVKNDGIVCIAVGASLHYTILSEFLWMLVIAILQYKKFVTVFQNRTPHIMAKACVICWCLPFIPILLLLSVFKSPYNKNLHGLCYLSEKFFYVGVVLPVASIVIINAFIFIKIIFSVCQKKIEVYGSTHDDVKLQVILAMFLFFLLGISWFFGLASSFGGGIIFSYLFCLTATFQGFIMFVFFVVMNENCKTLWMSCKRALCATKKNRRCSNSSVCQTDY